MQCRIMPSKARPFQIYASWNLVRYISIGILIFCSNVININDVNGYKKYCCDCYYISLSPDLYNIHEDERFDLSYCIPECTDCNYCKSYYDNNATASYNDNTTDTCPLGNYTNNAGEWNWDWNHETGCHKHISISSMRFLSKSYALYGISALVITIIYALFISLMLFQVARLPDFAKSLYIWIFIYNVLISEVCLYLLFKPFQYYHKDINVGDDIIVTCEIDSIKDTMEIMFNWVIWIAMIFVFTHFLYMIVHLCSICYKCIDSKRHQNRGRQNSVNLILNNDINDGKNLYNYYKMTSVRAKTFCCKWSLIGFVIIFTMIFFLGLTIYATIIMIVAGTKTDDYDAKKLTMITIVTILIFSSLIDSPWMWRRIYHRCKKRGYDDDDFQRDIRRTEAY